MFQNIGTTEILIVLVLVLILFGASILPKFGKGLGESQKEIKKAAKEFKEVVKEK